MRNEPNSAEENRSKDEDDARMKKIKNKKMHKIRFKNYSYAVDLAKFSSDDSMLHCGLQARTQIKLRDDYRLRYEWNDYNMWPSVSIEAFLNKKELERKVMKQRIYNFEEKYGTGKMNTNDVFNDQIPLDEGLDEILAKIGVFNWEEDEKMGDLSASPDINLDLKNKGRFMYENTINTQNENEVENVNREEEAVILKSSNASPVEVNAENNHTIIKSDLEVEYLDFSDETNNIIDNISKIKKEIKRADFLEEENTMLFFIDKCIECKDNIADILLDIKLCPNTYNVNLGSRIYSVKKFYHNSDKTIFDALLSFCVLTDDLQSFMISYKVLRITGTIIHPLTKIKEVSPGDKYVIVTNITNLDLGIDSDIFKDRRILGLRNLGNSCYMNSSLQAIINCKEFSDYFYSCDDKKLAIKKKLSASFSELVKEFDTTDEYIAPIKFKRILGSKINIYNERSEQDAMEFITDLLDLIHEEIKIKRRSKNDTLDGYQKWQIENESIVTNLFFCKIVSSIVCSECQNSRSIYEPCLYLPVPVPLKKEYYNDIVLFYDSPQRIPLKIFAEMSFTILELKEYVKKEYNITNEIFCCQISSGTLFPVNDFSFLRSLRDTLFCYEYVQEKVQEYFWVKISKRYFLWSSYLDFFILGHADKDNMSQNGDINQEFIYELVKERLIPFIDQTKSGLFHETPSSIFSLSYDHKDNTATNIYNRSQIRLQISHNNFLKLFGFDFNPIKQMVHLISEKIDLRDCIENFLVREYIFGNDKQLCDGCNQYTIHYKDTDIVKLPKYLIIQLKRFRFTGIDFEKIDTFIEFSLDHFYIKENKYKVISVINHITPSRGYAFRSVGSNGHYTAYVRYKDNWFLCNDHVITKVNKLDKSDAYIFILERLD
jgi:ubiquitin C-terminal hydrolase